LKEYAIMFIHHGLFSRTSIPAVEKSLDASALRARAIASNIANVSTPGYQRIEVEFESQLKKALDGRQIKGNADQAGHLPLGRPDLSQVEAVAYRAKDDTKPGEVNNVDIDIEMAKLAENQILFQYGVKFIGGRKEDILSAIKGQA
jgi:flagellar basal-body rod protein FlgB